MQNKGLITVFAVLFGLVSLYQLSYTYIASNVEDDAKAYSHDLFTADQPNERATAYSDYLDSVTMDKQLFGIDYKTAKEKYGIHHSTFTKAIDSLVEKGFLDLSHQGQGVKGDWNRYAISKRWEEYGTGEFKAAKRPRRKTGFGKSF